MGRTTHSTLTVVTCTSAPPTVPGRCTCRLIKAPSRRRPGSDRGTAARRASATTTERRTQQRHTVRQLCGAVISRFRPAGWLNAATPLKGMTSPRRARARFFKSTRPQLKRFRRLRQPRQHHSLGVPASRYPPSAVVAASSGAKVSSPWWVSLVD